MNSQAFQSLLVADDPPPVRVINPRGGSVFLLVGDHAGNSVPRELGSLGVSEDDMTRHIAWDIGVGGLGDALSTELDAMFICQTYSRLVVDCNRDPLSVEAMPVFSDGTAVPGNVDLTPAARKARLAEIHLPYQTAIAQELAARAAAKREVILVSLHSFTPSMNGVARPWDIGVLFSGGETSFARSLLKLLEQSTELCVGNNEPYAMDSSDYTVPCHSFGSGYRYAELEIRQDLLYNSELQTRWSKLLAQVLPEAARSTYSLTG